MKTTVKLLAYGALLASIGLAGVVTARAADYKLLNVSYDPTRELYQAYNDAFAKHWAATHPGDTVTVDISNGGSGAQAKAVIDGLQADVVTLAVKSDIDAIAAKGLLDTGWEAKFPDKSLPYTSTIVFLVRHGNPKAVKDWPDLIKGDVQVIAPNPKTSGGARWAYLAAWAYANKAAGGDEAKTKDYIKSLYQHVPVLDSGARGSTVTFTQKQIGDVELAWENDAILAQQQFGADQYDIIYPPSSILAEPPVALVDKNADAHGNREVATEYLNYLYSPEGQTIAAQNHYRPINPDVVTDKSLLDAFPKIALVTIDDPIFGGWAKAQPYHFGDGGIFDQIYTPGQ